MQQDRIAATAFRTPKVSLSAAELRRELSGRNLALAEGMVHESTFGAVPSVVYQEVDGEHGNFLAASYRRICAAPDWRRRLKKCYTASRRVARSGDLIRRELDCANSSDALLMNVFCYPGVTSRPGVCSLLGTEPGLRPEFGIRPGTPLASGRADRTEIDMSLGHLLVEAKLTESDFQTARHDLVLRYKELEAVFDVNELTVCDAGFHSYQLIRGVLAAQHRGQSFLLLCDGRRMDLSEAWYRIVRTVLSCELRARLAILTWQELAAVLPRTVQKLLSRKFGIDPASSHA
ncbi:MAG: PGN_0703 family putative restriction endonuclease [Candidatus Korobacteraceae bacterium]